MNIFDWVELLYELKIFADDFVSKMKPHLQRILMSIFKKNQEWIFVDGVVMKRYSVLVIKVYFSMRKYIGISVGTMICPYTKT